MGNVQIKRDHKAELHMFVDGVPALGCRVQKVEYLGPDVGMCAIVYVPLREATIGEVGNVISFPRPVTGGSSG